MRSGSATELSAYTYQRAIKLTPLGKAPVLVAPVTVRVPLKRPRAAETDHTNQTRQTVASPLLHRGSRPRFPSSNRPLQPCQDTRCIAWLGRGFGFASNLWHFELLPAFLLFLRWHVLDVRGNPPNVSAGVFHSAISFSVRQCHDGKHRNTTGFERLPVDLVRISNIQVNRGGHRPELRSCLAQHEHGISDSHLRVSNGAVWLLLAVSF